MNRNDKFNAKHSQDKNIIIGVVAALLILGGAMVWLTNMNPGLGADGATATTTPVTAVNFATSTAVMHEWLGIVWYRLKLKA